MPNLDRSAPALLFRAGPQLCAIDLGQVVETMRPLHVRPVAGTPDAVSGVCVMRGVPVPVLDVGVLLSGARADVSRFVAVRGEQAPVALATGPVVGIRPVTADPTTERLRDALGGSAAVVSGIGTDGTEPLLLLDGSAVLAVVARAVGSAAWPEP